MKSKEVPVYRKICILFLAVSLSGCAALYHVQVGEVDSRSGPGTPFDIKVSETGVSTEDIKTIGKATNTQAGKNASELADIVALFQIGHRTGNPVYDAKYAENLIREIHKVCPSGRVTGLMSVRESRNYPVISGEIVKIKGICLKPRSPAALAEGESNVE